MLEYISIFLNDQELVIVLLHTHFGDCPSFSYDFQRHKQEMTYIRLVLQKQAKSSFVCMTKLFFSVWRIFKAGPHLFSNTAVDFREHVLT